MTKKIFGIIVLIAGAILTFMTSRYGLAAFVRSGWTGDSLSVARSICGAGEICGVVLVVCGGAMMFRKQSGINRKK